MKIRSHIGPCAQQPYGPFPVPGMVMVLLPKPPGRNGFPLSLLVQALTDTDHRLAGLQPFLYIALLIRTPEQYHILVQNQLPAGPGLLIVPAHIPWSLLLMPSHTDPLILHGLCLHKSKAALQKPVHGIAERNLMMIDVIGYKGYSTGFSHIFPPVSDNFAPCHGCAAHGPLHFYNIRPVSRDPATSGSPPLPDARIRPPAPLRLPRPPVSYCRQIPCTGYRPHPL